VPQLINIFGQPDLFARDRPKEPAVVVKLAEGNLVTLLYDQTNKPCQREHAVCLRTASPDWFEGPGMAIQTCIRFHG
jgi:predicted SnoaL-like aldol condensation-catalyzing enzyme